MGPVWRTGHCAVPIAGRMLAEMPRVRSVFAKILLLAAAAIQPLGFALSLAPAVGQTASDASALGPVVICSAHGAVVLRWWRDGRARPHFSVEPAGAHASL